MSFLKYITLQFLLLYQNLTDDATDREHGVTVITDVDLRWQHCNIKYIPLLLILPANRNANEKGAKEAILFRDGLIFEGTHTNLLAVKNNTVYTAPEGKQILSGITR